MEVTDETGVYLVKLAREAAEKWIKGAEIPKPTEPIPDQAQLTTGAFVTVKKLVGNDHQLRGCIGYPIGIKSLVSEVVDLARESTLNDPRFSPVHESEISSLLFEVTVLTPPQEIEYEN